MLKLSNTLGRSVVSGLATLGLCASLMGAPLLLTSCSSAPSSTNTNNSDVVNSSSVDIATLKSRAEERFQDLGQYVVDQTTWKAFAANTAAEVLGLGPAGTQGADGVDDAALKNCCFSPASLFFAVSLLAEGADGEAQQQLLELLGLESADELAVFCTEWMDQLTDTYANAEVEIANSVWANEGYSFTDHYLELIDEALDATADTVSFGTADADGKIKSWITEETNGLLSPDIQTRAGEIAWLINTIYFKDSWLTSFEAASTTDEPFHSPTGDVSAPFMHQSAETGSYAVGNDFTAAQLPLSGGGTMSFYLPNEGTSVEGLVANAAAIDDLLSTEFEASPVNWSLPKFTIDSSFKDLVDNLRDLGVIDVFDGGIPGMFGSMLNGGETAEFYVSDAIQETHIGIDENGVEAAAYTAIAMREMALLAEGEPVDFVLDRPFVYTVQSSDGVVLFMGVVDDPTA